MRKLLIVLGVMFLVGVGFAQTSVYSRVGANTISFVKSIYPEHVYRQSSSQYVECKRTARQLREVSGIDRNGYSEIFVVALDFASNPSQYGRALGGALARDGYTLMRTTNDGSVTDIFIFGNFEKNTVVALLMFYGGSVFMPDAHDGDVCLIVYGGGV